MYMYLSMCEEVLLFEVQDVVCAFIELWNLLNGQ